MIATLIATVIATPRRDTKGIAPRCARLVAMPFHRPALALSAVLAAAACDPAPAASWEVDLRTPVDTGAFLSAWGPDASEVYAVGGNPEAGAMFRFDGQSWSPTPLPPDTPLVNWVHGIDGALWIAGNEGTVARRDAEGSWQTFAPATDQALWGIWAAAADEVWAVGGDFPAGQPVLAHYRGDGWSLVELPPLDRDIEALLKVWGTSADAVHAVGHRGVVLGYDGSEWSQRLAGTSADLISLWGAGPNEIVAVGGRSNGVIARFDGDAWTSEIIGQLPGLNGVWMDPEGTAFAVGIDGVIIEIAPGGFEWREIDRSTRPDTLHGAFGLATGERFGVGGSLLFSAPWTGVIAQYLP